MTFLAAWDVVQFSPKGRKTINQYIGTIESSLLLANCSAHPPCQAPSPNRSLLSSKYGTKPLDYRPLIGKGAHMEERRAAEIEPMNSVTFFGNFHLLHESTCVFEVLELQRNKWKNTFCQDLPIIKHCIQHIKKPLTLIYYRKAVIEDGLPDQVRVDHGREFSFTLFCAGVIASHPWETNTQRGAHRKTE